MQETKDILMMRLHMIKLECNFRNRKENQRCERYVHMLSTQSIILHAKAWLTCNK